MKNLKKKIDFVIVGFDKCGTTDLAHFLNDKNSFYLPTTEISIFEDEKDITNIKNYLLNFTKKKINGIFRPSYIYQWSVLNRIYSYNNNIKIIVIFREPVSRFISHFLHFIRYDFIEFRNIQKNMIKLLNQDKKFLSKFPRTKEILKSSNNFFFIKKLYKIFHKKNILILNFEEIKMGNYSKLNNFFNVQAFRSKEIKKKIINKSNYTYLGVFLERIRNKLRYRKEKLRVYSVKLNLIEKIKLKIIEIFLKYNFIKIKIKISPKVKTKIKQKYNYQYKKLLKFTR